MNHPTQRPKQRYSRWWQRYLPLVLLAIAATSLISNLNFDLSRGQAISFDLGRSNQSSLDATPGLPHLESLANLTVSDTRESHTVASAPIPTHPRAATEAHSDHSSLLELVPENAATHRAIASGSWFDAATWEGDVPGTNARVIIPAGVDVTYDGQSDARLFTVRIDGALSFAPQWDTRMRVDLIVVNAGGNLTIGTAANPVHTDTTTDIIFAPVDPNQRLIDTHWDAHQLSRGLVALKDASVTVWGAEKTPYLALQGHAAAGDRTLTVERTVPDSWQVGDRIVLTGTAGAIDWQNERLSHADNSIFQDEVLTIERINGKDITFNHADGQGTALRFDHQAPAGYGLKIYVANLTRTVQFRTEAGESAQIMERGHLMFMGQDVEFHNAGIYDMGRSNKDRIAHPESNRRGRYPFHLHQTLLQDTAAYGKSAAQVTGNAIAGSPGWGYVIHSSKAVVEDNVSFDVLGAHYVTEDGDEIAEFRRNMAIKAPGAQTDPGADLLQLDNSERGRQRDVGVMGYGFWFDAPYSAFAVEDNIVASTYETAYMFYGHNDREFTEDKRGENFSTPTPGLVQVPVSTLPPHLRAIAHGATTIHAWKVPNPGTWSNNIAYNSESGVEFRGVLRNDNGDDTYFNLGHQTPALIDGLKIWGVRNFGIGIGYASNIHIKNSLVLGNVEAPLPRDQHFVGVTHNGMDGHGIFLAKNARYIILDNNRIEGFEVGAVVQQTEGQGLNLENEERDSGQVTDAGQLRGGYFAHNTYNLGAAPGRVGNQARDTPMYFNNPFNPFFKISNTPHFESPSTNQPPVAEFSTSSTEPSTIQFNANASVDTDYPLNDLTDNKNTITSYAWDFDDDGVYDDWGWIVNRPLSPGQHTVSLTVYDQHGLSSTKRATIEVSGTSRRIISESGSRPNPTAQSEPDWVPAPGPSQPTRAVLEPAALPTPTLNAGRNTIRLTAIGRSGGDFDALTITPD